MLFKLWIHYVKLNEAAFEEKENNYVTEETCFK